MKISAIRRFRSKHAVLLGLLTAALFAGPAFTFAKAAQPPPSPQARATRPTMTAPTALRQIRDGLKNAGIRGGDERFRHHLENIAVTLTGFSYTEVDDVERWATQPRSRSFLYSEIPAFSVDYFSPFLPNAPGLPEGVRRSQLLAEDAIRNKSFEEAIDHYEQGLQALPLWPEGQFNAALLYGELGIYGQAVLHMKRYLELRPDAPDAPSARDQIVIWQAKIR